MALITKQVLVCNKCGTEVTNGSSNVTILGEDFYFCDECLERLLNWVTPVSELNEATPVSKNEVVVEKTTTSVSREKGQRFSATNVRWDEYNIDKVLTMVEQGMGNEDIGKALCTSSASIMCLLSRIKYSKPGTEKYPYRERFLNITRKRGRHAMHMEKEGDD